MALCKTAAYATMSELVYGADLKSAAHMSVWVRPPLVARFLILNRGRKKNRVFVAIVTFEENRNSEVVFTCISE